jgi:hypothetical protein
VPFGKSMSCRKAWRSIPCDRVGFVHYQGCLNGWLSVVLASWLRNQWAIYHAAAVYEVLRVMAASQIIHAKLRSHDAMMSIEGAESKPSVPATQPWPRTQFRTVR